MGPVERYLRAGGVDLLRGRHRGGAERSVVVNAISVSVRGHGTGVPAPAPLLQVFARW